MTAAPVVAGETLRVLPPVKLFTSCQSTTPATFSTGPLDLNATADGMCFLVRCSLQDNAFTAFGVMLNWSSAPR